MVRRGRSRFFWVQVFCLFRLWCGWWQQGARPALLCTGIAVFRKAARARKGQIDQRDSIDTALRRHPAATFVWGRPCFDVMELLWKQRGAHYYYAFLLSAVWNVIVLFLSNRKWMWFWAVLGCRPMYVAACGVGLSEEFPRRQMDIQLTTQPLSTPEEQKKRVFSSLGVLDATLCTVRKNKILRKIPHQ